MHDAVAVRGGKRVEQRVGEQLDLSRCQPARLANMVGQRSPAEVREDEHDLVAVVDQIDQTDDVRVIEASEGFGLSSNSLAGAIHVTSAAVEHEMLERYEVAALVMSEVDDPHRTPSEALLDLIAHTDRPA